jgi:hypothetical protein
MSSHGLGVKDANSHFINNEHPCAAFGKKAAFALSHDGYGFGILFVKGVRFFFSHFRHLVLLLGYQSQQCRTARHGVEHIYRVFVDTIVHYFNQIAMGIKAYQKVLVNLIFHRLFIQKGLGGVQYVENSNPVLESSMIELNTIVHYSIIPQKEVFANV